jgi:hypothetical protein
MTECVGAPIAPLSRRTAAKRAQYFGRNAWPKEQKFQPNVELLIGIFRPKFRPEGPSMIGFAIIGFAIIAASVGFLLGCAQLRVIVLLPAVIVLLISIWLFSGPVDLGGRPAALAGILGTVGLQAGYLLAVLERFVRQDGATNTKSSAFGLSRFI